MKKQWIIFWLSFSPAMLILFGITAYLGILTESFVLVLAAVLWAFNTTFSPILHFGAVCILSKNNKINKSTAVLSMLSYFLSVAISYGCLMLAVCCTPMLENKDKYDNFTLEDYYMEALTSDFVTNMIWVALCFFIIVGCFALTSLMRSSLKFKMLLGIKAVLVLIITALFPVWLDFVNGYLEMDWYNYGIWIYLKPFILIALFSFIFGVLVKRRLFMVLWPLGIVTSVCGFILLCEDADVLRIMIEQPTAISTIMPIISFVLILASAIPIAAFFWGFYDKGAKNIIKVFYRPIDTPTDSNGKSL